MNQKQRSLANSRSEAQRIYYQRKEIKRLQQEIQRKDNEIKQLREDIVNHVKIASEYKEQMIIKDNNWNELKNYVDKLYESETYHSMGEVLDKINELEK